MTAGAGSDFRAATNRAYHMVARWGMTDALGKAVYEESYLSSETKTKIDVEVARILEEEYQNAYQMLVEHRDKLEIVAQLLLEKEVVDAHEIYEALGMQSPDIVTIV
jgi:ATP-dependent Zn protease